MKTKGLLIAAAVGVFSATTGYAAPPADPRCTVERPTYPNSALRGRVSGTAVVAITVEANGAVRSTQLVSPSGGYYLDEAALKSASAAKCAPGAAETLTQVYTFSLPPRGQQ